MGKRVSVADTATGKPALDVGFWAFNGEALKFLSDECQVFVLLCGPLRISASSAVKSTLNAENAEIRRGQQRETR